MKPSTYIGVVLASSFMVAFISCNILRVSPFHKNAIQNSVVSKQPTPQHNAGVINRCYFYTRIGGGRDFSGQGITTNI